jgi:hypothetical protein
VILTVPFSNPIVAGTVLVREAIQSEDYVHGVSGWRIGADGTAEFQGATVTGGTGTVVIDDTGLWVRDANGTYVRLYDAAGTTGATIELQPPDLPGKTWTPGTIYGTTYGGASQPTTGIISPAEAGHTPSSVIIIGGTATASPVIALNGDAVYSGGIHVFEAGYTVFSGLGQKQYAEVTTPVTINNTSALQDLAELEGYAVANAKYEVHGQLVYSAATDADAQFAMDCPPGSTFDWSSYGPAQDASSWQGGVVYEHRTATDSSWVGGAGVGAKRCIRPQGILTTGANPNVVRWKAAQWVAKASDLVIYPGSYIIWDRIG